MLDPGATEIIKKYGFDPTLQKIPSETEVRRIISGKTGKKNSNNPMIRNIAKKESKALSEYLKLVKFKQVGTTQKASGIYTQPKRNACKISQKGQYGGLVIDLPKLFGHLKVVAHKNGKVQNMDPWSMDPLRGPGPWTGSMDPLLLLPLKLLK